MVKSWFGKILGGGDSNTPTTPVPQASTDLTEILASPADVSEDLVASLNILGTIKTPTISYDPKEKKMILSGKSIPEEAATFWKPILDAIKSLPKNGLTSIEFNIQYFNTSSSKFVLDIFKEALKHFYKDSVQIVWKYEAEDEDMLEAGKDYEDIIQSYRNDYGHIKSNFVFEVVED